MKVAFIQRDAYEKIGVHQLAACLKGKDVEYDVFIEELEKDFYGHIKAYRPDFVLYSLYIGEEDFMLNSFAKLKNIVPDMKTVVGGPFTLVFPEVVKNKAVDFLIRGDGEHSLPLFLRLYQDGHNVKEVPGMCFVDEDGGLFMNEKIQLTSDIAALPAPDRDMYYKYESLRRKDTKMFIASRGCPYSCTYCYNSGLKKFFNTPYWRLRSPEDVIHEIEYVRDEYGLRWVHFQDGTFNANATWLKSFLIEYKKRVLPPFLCNCRVEKINEEVISLMKQAGCDRITFGIQSGNDEIRRKLAGRPMSNRQIEDAFELCHEYGIRVGADIIFGWPGESVNQAMDTIHLCRKIKADSYHSNVLICYPGLAITRKAVECGYLNRVPTLGEVEGLNPNKSLIGQENIRYLINMDKLFYYMIKLPGLERFFKMLLWLPPNRFFLMLKDLHLLKRSLKYDSNGIMSCFRIIRGYIGSRWKV